jgi:hypothetical protein
MAQAEAVAQAGVVELEWPLWPLCRLHSQPLIAVRAAEREWPDTVPHWLPRASAGQPGYGAHSLAATGASRGLADAQRGQAMCRTIRHNPRRQTPGNPGRDTSVMNIQATSIQNVKRQSARVCSLPRDKMTGKPQQQQFSAPRYPRRKGTRQAQRKQFCIVLSLSNTAQFAQPQAGLPASDTASAAVRWVQRRTRSTRCFGR